MNHSPRSAAAGLCLLTALSACNCDDDLYSTPGSMRGVVCSTGSGQPLAGVSVVVTDGAGNTHDATSDGFGLYRAENLATGDGTVTINEPGAEPRSFPVEIDATIEAEIIDGLCHPPIVPPPPPSGTVSGCVCDRGIGAWVDGANVFVLTAEGGLVVTGTGPDGCFVLEGVPEGAQTVQIEKGVFVEAHDVVVVVGETSTLPVIDDCVPAPPPPPGEVGVVEGRVCAPDGTTWLNAADAFVDLSGGGRVGDQTDVDGHYRIENVPIGAQVVHIQKGSFSADVNVTVTAGATTVVPEAECEIIAAHLKIAVVTGDYDRVQDVLAGIGIEEGDVDLFESNGFDDGWVDALLLDYAVLSQYDIVFLNCGLGDLGFTARFFGVNPAIVGANLRQFVQEGGSIYASDWAYHVVEKTWPEFVDFRGDDATAQTAKVGAAPQDQTANIIDGPMSIALGQTSMVLHYPLNAWVVMEAVSPSTTIYIRGDADIVENGVASTLTDVPHTVAFRPGSGRVLYTSFHQEAGINPDMQRVLQLLIFEL